MASAFFASSITPRIASNDFITSAKVFPSGCGRGDKNRSERQHGGDRARRKSVVD